MTMSIRTVTEELNRAASSGLIDEENRSYVQKKCRRELLNQARACSATSERAEGQGLAGRWRFAPGERHVTKRKEGKMAMLVARKREAK